MTLSLLQALSFFLLTAGYVLRDYPWKNEIRSRAQAFYSVVALAILALLGSLAVILSGAEGDKSPLASGLVIVSAVSLFTVVILSITVWSRKKRDMKSDDQRMV